MHDVGEAETGSLRNLWAPLPDWFPSPLFQHIPIHQHEQDQWAPGRSQGGGAPSGQRADLLGVSQKQRAQGPSQGREEVQGITSDDSTWAGVPNQAPGGLGEDGPTDASPITPVRREARAPFGGRPGLQEGRASHQAPDLLLLLSLSPRVARLVSGAGV